MIMQNMASALLHLRLPPISHLIITRDHLYTDQA